MLTQKNASYTKLKKLIYLYTYIAYTVQLFLSGSRYSGHLQQVFLFGYKAQPLLTALPIGSCQDVNETTEVFKVKSDPATETDTSSIVPLRSVP